MAAPQLPVVPAELLDHVKVSPSTAKCRCGVRATRKKDAEDGASKRGGWTMNHWYDHFKGKCMDPAARIYRAALRKYRQSEMERKGVGIHAFLNKKKPGRVLQWRAGSC